MNIKDFISSERLATFGGHTDTEERAIALHNHTLQLGSSLMSMIALFELSLRNSANLQLINTFEDQDWLLPSHTSIPLKRTEENSVKGAVRHARKAAYAKLSHQEKLRLDATAFPNGIPAAVTYDQKVKQRQAQMNVSHGQVISQTTFYFWKRLFSSDYNATLWKTSLKKVFPNKRIKRPDVARALEVVYSTRNRVAHHEPVYGDRLEEAVANLSFLRDSLGANNGQEETSFKKLSRVQYLRLRMDQEAFLEAWRTLT